MKVKIAVIGAGYIGLVNAYGYASMGHYVDLYDNDHGKINKLQSGILPIYENGLQELAREYTVNPYHIDNIIEKIQKYDVIIICVGTPLDENNNVNLSFIENVFFQLSQYKFNASIIIRSTIPPGASKKLKSKYNIQNKIIFLPEFLKAGSAIKDFLNPDRIVIGGENNDIDIIYSLHRNIQHDKFICMSIESAELAKYASNTMLALRISFMNELAMLCDSIGANIDDIAEGIGIDQRIGPSFLHAGPGFGGSCLPKDTAGLIKSYEEHHIQPLICSSILSVNDRQLRYLADKIIRLPINTIGIYGLSFKHGTDDIRGSISIKLIELLLNDRPMNIHAYDPIITGVTDNRVISAPSLYSMLENVECMVIMHDVSILGSSHDKITAIESLRVIVDPFGRMDRIKCEEAGLTYISIGR